VGRAAVIASLKIVMMGTGPFAAPTFRAIYDSPHKVLALVTRPPRQLHGKTQAEVNPMRPIALERGTPVFEPESINTDAARAELAGYAPDLFVVCDYGQILAPATLAVARLGGINLHASLLPKYRGAAPINWALFFGETLTGVTVIHMTPRVDAGPAIAQQSTPIGSVETAVDLEPRLAALGAPLVLQAMEAVSLGSAAPLEQDPKLASRAPRLKKSDGQIDWSRPAESIKNQIRAMQPWPKTYTFWPRPAGEPLRLIVEDAEVLAPSPEAPSPEAPSGCIIEAGKDRLVVATGQGGLLIKSIQPSGKRVLTAGEFLRGYSLRPGQNFGNA